MPADDLTDPAPATTFAHLDATTVLARSIAELGIYPAVDPLDSTSRMLDPRILGDEHYGVARGVQKVLQDYKNLQVRGYSGQLHWVHGMLCSWGGTVLAAALGARCWRLDRVTTAVRCHGVSAAALSKPDAHAGSVSRSTCDSALTPLPAPSHTGHHCHPGDG